MLLNGLFWVVPLLVAWLIVLSILLYKTLASYNRLVSSTGKEDIKSILEELLLSQNKLGQRMKETDETLLDLNKRVSFHIQKLGVVRFNPFSEIGGDQSFALALLNEHDDGVVILSLHGREGTRIYIKKIKGGKSQIELSGEERQAINEARKNEFK